MSSSDSRYDVVVIGSGFGGAMAAHAPVLAGARVLMLERGGWVDRGPHNWEPGGAMELTPFYSRETPVRVHQGRRASMIGLYHCVGGQSVFSGAVALRFRERDFMSDPEIVGASGAQWPFAYDELEPFYARAERLLDVAGESGIDPTEPPRTGPYPHGPARLSTTSGVIEGAARELGLHPFRLPLAINYQNGVARRACQACTTCDAFACAVEAKNDVATAIIPGLLRAGMELRPRTVVTKLVLNGDRITAVECIDRDTGRAWQAQGDVVVLAAGVLATPHLLLTSGLQRANPAGHAVGRYLMRHCNGLVYGFFRHPPNPAREFHKQIGIHDFYFGHRNVPVPRGKLGCIQQVMAPPIGLIQARVPALLARVLSLGVDHVTGLLAIAEDTPQLTNGVTVDWQQRDVYGLPLPVVRHEYASRDLLARQALVRESKRVLRRAGAPLFYVHSIRDVLPRRRHGSHGHRPRHIAAGRAGPLSRGTQSLGYGRERHADIGGGESQSYDLRHCPPCRRGNYDRKGRVTNSAHRTPARPLGIAFLGCGAVARAHSRTLRKLDSRLRLYYASRDGARAADLNTACAGAGAFASYAAALADPGVDAVLVVTPPAFHLQWTLQALAAGKDVIVEKPPFARAADFDAVEAAARSASRQVMVAENYFYKPVLRVLRTMLREGTIGEPRFLDIKALKTQRVHGWRDDATLAKGGALYEGGIHWIDFLANLGLDVMSVHGFRPGRAVGLDREMLVVARYAQGAVATLFFSWNTPSLLKGVRLSHIYGTEGSITFESNGLFALALGKRTRLHFPGVRDLTGSRAMFRDFLSAIRERRAPEFTLALARRDLELVEAAYQSADQLTPSPSFTSSQGF